MLTLIKLQVCTPFFILACLIKHIYSCCVFLWTGCDRSIAPLQHGRTRCPCFRGRGCQSLCQGNPLTVTLHIMERSKFIATTCGTRGMPYLHLRHDPLICWAGFMLGANCVHVRHTSRSVARRSSVVCTHVMLEYMHYTISHTRDTLTRNGEVVHPPIDHLSTHLGLYVNHYRHCICSKWYSLLHVECNSIKSCNLKFVSHMSQFVSHTLQPIARGVSFNQLLQSLSV